jgi:hypothetical protein
MSNFQLVRICMISLAMMVFANVTFAQSSTSAEPSAQTKQPVYDRSLDIAPTAEDKPHIIGDDGKKIYFLAPPAAPASPAEKRHQNKPSNSLHSGKPE